MSLESSDCAESEKWQKKLSCFNFKTVIIPLKDRFFFVFSCEKDVLYTEHKCLEPLISSISISESNDVFFNDDDCQK